MHHGTKLGTNWMGRGVEEQDLLLAPFLGGGTIPGAGRALPRHTTQWGHWLCTHGLQGILLDHIWPLAPPHWLAL